MFTAAPTLTPARSGISPFGPMVPSACAERAAAWSGCAAGCGWSAITARPAHELMQDAAFVSRYVVDLALGLKAAIMLLNPARIVIGGGISKAGDKLFVPLRAELGRQITGWSRARIDVVPAALGDDSVLFGALALATI